MKPNGFFQRRSIPNGRWQIVRDEIQMFAVLGAAFPDPDDVVRQMQTEGLVADVKFAEYRWVPDPALKA